MTEPTKTEASANRHCKMVMGGMVLCDDLCNSIKDHCSYTSALLCNSGSFTVQVETKAGFKIKFCPFCGSRLFVEG